MDNLEDIAGLAIAIAIWIAQAVAKARKERGGQPQRAPAPRPRPKARPRPVPPPPPPAPGDFRRPKPPAPARPAGDAVVLRALADLEARAAELADRLELERPSRRFVPALREWLPAQVRVLREAARAGELDGRHAQGALARLHLVIREIDALAEDRRTPAMAAALGDADALAAACYRPIIDHAEAEGWPLAAATPATWLTETDLAIWVGFQPTGIAPIFLPEDFFRRAAWWPALSHEIGHSFLASLRGLDPALRRDLGLPSEASGTRLLDVEGGGLSQRELVRVLGGWFEEIFCDVFGTLMCGPAYVRSMLELFPAEDDPREVLAVRDRGGRYDVHPPRHLRVLVGCKVLERQGLSEEAEALREQWDARHAVDGRPPDRILFQMGDGFLAVPLEPLEALVGEITERLAVGPLDALGGAGLDDISGLDFGPHEHQESLRARDALLAGRVPRQRDPRAVFAGAALAAAQQPALEPAIMAQARAAIPALDSGEVRPDAYQPAAATSAGAARRPVAPAGAFTREEIRDAIVLAEVLARPPAATRAGGTRRTPGR